MKHILFCILFMFSTITLAQTIENPTFKVRSGSITNIIRIERTPKNTRVFIHAIFRPPLVDKRKRQNLPERCKYR